MKIIGLTGGIGSGKTTVLQFLKKWGAATYIADERAKFLMQNDSQMAAQVKKILGTNSYVKGLLNKKYIAGKIFKNETLLKKINALVHKRVRSDFKDFQKTIQSELLVYETALLFENKSELFCDATILVTAPKPLRLQRIMLRDRLEKEQILNKMKHQLPDAVKIPKADYVLKNDTTKTQLEKEVQKIYTQIIGKAHLQ